MEQEDPAIHSKGLLRIAREPRKTSAPLVVDETTSAWEVYNDRAITIDRELIKDWNESLNTLLIFAALYSAILTAFIIESMKLLQEDATETTRDILLIITRQLANNSFEPFEQQPFIAPEYAVRVNYYFFLSLSFSLVAALGAVLALQWVGAYDAGLNQSSPEERALQRHFRYRGVEEWKMVQIIAFLPGLIFISLLLFFIGMAEWVWSMHRGIAGVVIAGLICGFGFFIITTMISMIYTGAPFRTPASRSLPRLFLGAYCALHALISHLTARGLLSSARSLMRAFVALKSKSARLWSGVQSQLSSIGHYLKTPHNLDSFEVIEEREVGAVLDRKRTALLWLTKRVNVLPNTVPHFNAIIREILLLPAEQLSDPAIGDAPWESIFTVILAPYMRLQRFTPEDNAAMEPTLQALSLVWDIPSANRVFGGTLRYTYFSISELANIVYTKWELAEQRFFPYLTSIMRSAHVIPTNQTTAHLMWLQRWLKQVKVSTLRVDGEDGWMFGTTPATILFAEAFILVATDSSSRLTDDVMDQIYDLLSYYFLQDSAPGTTAVARYIRSLRSFIQGEEQAHLTKDDAEAINDAIICHYISDPDFAHGVPTRSHAPSLFELQELVSLNTSAPHVTTTVNVILEVLQRSYVWDETNRKSTAGIYGSVLAMPYRFEGQNIDWGEWRTAFYLCLNTGLQGENHAIIHSKQSIWGHASNEAQYNHERRDPTESQIKRLSVIKYPSLNLYASIGAEASWVYPSVIPAVGAPDWEAWKQAVDLWSRSHGHSTQIGASCFSFLRLIITDWPGKLHMVLGYLERLETIDGEKLSPEHWYSLLQAPALEIIMGLRLSLWDPPSILRLFERVCGYSWFLPEFQAAGGMSWIEGSGRAVSTEIAGLFCAALEAAISKGQAEAWMTCLRKTLIPTGRWRVRRPTWLEWEPNWPKGFYPHTFGSLLQVVQNIYSAQTRYRTVPDHGSSASAIFSPRNLPTEVDKSSRLYTSNDQEPPVQRPEAIVDGGRNLHTYARDWSTEEWDQWKELTEEVIGGLRRGFIAVEPLSISNFVRDPDGQCWRM